MAHPVYWLEGLRMGGCVSGSRESTQWLRPGAAWKTNMGPPSCGHNHMQEGLQGSGALWIVWRSEVEALVIRFPVAKTGCRNIMSLFF